MLTNDRNCFIEAKRSLKSVHQKSNDVHFTLNLITLNVYYCLLNVIQSLRMQKTEKERVNERGEERKKSRQVAQLSQRNRTAGWVSYGQKWKTGTARQCLRT